MTTIEGEKINTAPEALPVAASDAPHQVAMFNPLEAEPVQFQRQLATRQENYDALAMHLRGMLVPDKDFGRIHVSKGCKDKYNCTNEYHYSGFTLFAAGADKVLGMLSLGVHYPNEQDFVRAALTGKQIQDVIMKCHILASNDTMIAEGMGACGRDEVNGNLNNCIKRACKRARLDAVLRLPGISALFEDDYLASVKAKAAQTGGNSTTGRAQQVVQKYNTGARLEEWPHGGKLAGQKFAEMETSALDWVCSKCQNQPDVFNAAKRELDKRAGSGDITPDPGPPAPETPSSDRDDWMAEYDAYAAQQDAPNV